MKSKHNPDLERAELAVEANLSKFSAAVDHLEDKITESRAAIESKVDKVKSIVNKPKDILNSVTDKAHDLSDRVSTSAHEITDRAHTLTEPYIHKTVDLGQRFWEKAEENPVPFIVGAAALFGGFIYLLFKTEDDDGDALWSY